MWRRERNTLQNPSVLCLEGKQIFSRSSGPYIFPEIRKKKSSSGERLLGRRGPVLPTYVMDVEERHWTDPSCESDLKANAHPSSLESRPVRVDKQTSPSESPVVVSTNLLVLEPTHVPVNSVAGWSKSAGSFSLPEAEEKTAVSGARPPWNQEAGSPKYSMEVSVKNITYPSCESDLNVNADPSSPLLSKLASLPVRVDKRTSLHQHPVAVSRNMFLAEQMSISGERPPGHRGPRVSTNLIDVADRNVGELSCESHLQATSHLSLPRLPRLASRPVRVDKRTSLNERPFTVSTNMSFLGINRVPVKPVSDSQKRGNVGVARIHFEDEYVKMKRVQQPKGIHPLVRNIAFAAKKPYSSAGPRFTPQTLSLNL